MLELRPYQDRAAAMLTRHRRGIVVVPAGGGKTIIAAAAISRVLNTRRTLNVPRATIRWIAGTTDQCDQARAALNKFSLFAHADIEIGCPGKIWRLRNPDLAVIDECHHVAADSWADSLNDCSRARWGFTATPFRNDERTAEIFQLIGQIIFQIGQDELRESGAIVPGVVRMVRISGAPVADRIERAAKSEFDRMKRRFTLVDPRELLNRCRYRFAKEFGIEKYGERNDEIIRSAFDNCSCAAPGLLLVGSIEHGEELLGSIAGGGMAAVLLHSKSKGRRKTVQDFRENRIPLMIATSLADEGFDAPCASTLILAAGGRAANRVEQRAGRVLRPAPGKTSGLIIDFLDTQHPFLTAQSRARVKVYRKLGYKIYEH